MCNCQEEIKRKVAEAGNTTPENVSCMNIEVCSGRYFSEYHYKVDGQKKEKKLMVLHTYCPTCGERYEQDGGAE